MGFAFGKAAITAAHDGHDAKTAHPEHDIKAGTSRKRILQPASAVPQKPQVILEFFKHRSNNAST